MDIPLLWALAPVYGSAQAATHTYPFRWWLLVSFFATTRCLNQRLLGDSRLADSAVVHRRAGGCSSPARRRRQRNRVHHARSPIWRMVVVDVHSGRWEMQGRKRIIDYSHATVNPAASPILVDNP